MITWPADLQVRAAVLAGKISLTGLAIAALIALLAVQTVRLEGFKFWPVEIEGALARAELYERALAIVAKRAVKAQRAAEAAKAEAEDNYRQLAERIDHEAEQDLRGQLDAAERFIAAGGVRRAADRCPRSGPATATGSDGTGDGEAAGGAPELDGPAGTVDTAAGLVLVTAEDVRICTRNTLQAEAARRWALELEAATREDSD